MRMESSMIKNWKAVRVLFVVQLLLLGVYAVLFILPWIQSQTPPQPPKNVISFSGGDGIPPGRFHTIFVAPLSPAYTVCWDVQSKSFGLNVTQVITTLHNIIFRESAGPHIFGCLLPNYTDVTGFFVFNDFEVNGNSTLRVSYTYTVSRT